MMANSFAGRGGWWVVGQGVLMATVVVSGVVWSRDWHCEWVFGVGLVFFAVGGVLGVLGVIHLGSNRSPYPAPTAASTLVQGGVYAFIRHPLYASVILASAGWALIWASVPALMITPVLAGFLDAKARREEQWLRGRHPGYAEYSGRVRRFIPWVY